MGVMEYTRKYLFPVQFTLAVIGNTLNLIVLNTPGMRTKTNCFLSAMAIADLCFFASLFPVYIDVFVTDNNLYDWFYYYSLIPLSSLANCFSAASIWLTVGVTLERVIAIRFPLLAKTYWKKSRIVIAIVLIYVISFLLSCYQMAWRKPRQFPEDTITPLKNDYVTVNETMEPGVFWYVHISHLLFGTVVIVIPLLVITLLNSVLIYHLRANKRSLKDFRRTTTLRIKRSEQKVTFLVVVLIIFFVVAYVPSGILTVWDAAAEIGRLDPPAHYSDSAEICNMLVCTGKALNFVLYCSASSNFRGKLVRLFRAPPVKHFDNSRRRVSTSLNNPTTISPEETMVAELTADCGSSPMSLRRGRRSTDVRGRERQRMLETLDGPPSEQRKRRTISLDTVALFVSNFRLKSYGTLANRAPSTENVPM